MVFLCESWGYGVWTEKAARGEYHSTEGDRTHEKAKVYSLDLSRAPSLLGATLPNRHALSWGPRIILPDLLEFAYLDTVLVGTSRHDETE
jgi:hypothetical protein